MQWTEIPSLDSLFIYQLYKSLLIASNGILKSEQVGGKFETD